MLFDKVNKIVDFIDVVVFFSRSIIKICLDKINKYVILVKELKLVWKLRNIKVKVVIILVIGMLFFV